MLLHHAIQLSNIRQLHFIFVCVQHIFKLSHPSCHFSFFFFNFIFILVHAVCYGVILMQCFLIPIHSYSTQTFLLDFVHFVLLISFGQFFRLRNDLGYERHTINVYKKCACYYTHYNASIVFLFSAVGFYCHIFFIRSVCLCVCILLAYLKTFGQNRANDRKFAKDKRKHTSIHTRETNENREKVK